MQAMTLTKDRPVLSSERAPHQKQDRNCQTVINIWPWAQDGARHQVLLADWPSFAMWLRLWRIDSWKGVAIQRGLEPGSRRITIVRSRYQAVTCENTGGWKRVKRVVCEVWMLVMALQLSVFISCVLKWSVNPVFNPKPRRESPIHVTVSLKLRHH
jgi:hypothetical protein